MLAAVIAAYAFGLPWSRGVQRAARPPAAPRVVVLPFWTPEAQPALADLRDAMQDLLASRFTGEGIPQAVDLQIVRAGLTGAARTDDEVARRLDARLLVRGVVEGTPDRLSIQATLVSEPGGMERARAGVAGSADSLPYLVDRLATGLLAGHAARDAAELAALGRTPLPALQAYLAGLEARRRGRRAEEYFERAAFLDSSFTLAVLGLAAIAELRGTLGGEQRWQFDAVWRRRDRLSPADRALLIAHLGPHYPRVSTLAQRVAAGTQAARVAPHRAEAWFIAGENLRRYGPLVGHAGWETEAVAAFERAFALDSTDAEALDRLLLLSAGGADGEAVRRYAGLYFAYNSSAESADFVRWWSAAALNDEAALAAVRRRLPDMSFLSLQRIVQWSHDQGVRVADGDRAADLLVRRASTTTERRVALNRMVRVLLNRGRPTEARRLLAESEGGFGPDQGVGPLDFRIYAALYWDGDTADAGSAVRRLEALIGNALVGTQDVRTRSAGFCALAHWRLAAGDLRGVRTALASARRWVEVADSLARSTTEVCIATVAAQLAALRGESEAAPALERLDSLLLAIHESRDLVYAVGNLVAARLCEARGDLPRALAVIRRRARWNAFLSKQLREEGRLAALTGHRASAARAYRHYLALRSDPEPPLRPEVAGVRSELERLDQGRAH